MNKWILAAILFVLMIVLSAFMHQRNESRSVVLDRVDWDANRPRLVSSDSVNKLLTLALSDSASAFKSGLNLKNIEQTLNQNAWVENAQSFVTIDGKIGVQLTSKLPIVRVEGDRNYYLDSQGNSFPLSKHQSVVVPLFYGNPTKEQCQTLVDVVMQTNQDPFMADHVISYQWLQHEGLAMEPRHQRYQIVIGSPKQLQQKFNKYKAFYAKMRDSAVLKTYKKVNLSFHSQVVCTK